jgi:redox-sensitive bicupin YhaK (pirin superfamily)
MPAVSADPTVLPRLANVPVEGTRWRRVRQVVTAGHTFEGEGFPVRRPFPGIDLSLADPFVLLDEMGAVDYGPGEAKGTAWHPHRGFETVTYMIDGVFEHQDSTGGGGTITNGATQWMTAGAGILHIERPPAWLVTKGGLFHGVQLWVNLPRADKWVPPRYQGIEAGEVTLLASHDAGALVRVIAGRLAGYHGPGSTHTPIIYAHATLGPGSRLAIPWPEDHNALVYALNGRGFVGAERHPLDDGQLAVLGAGDAFELAAAEVQPSSAADGWEVLLLGGVPIGEPIARYGPFVMNTRDDLVQAVEDYQAGRMGVIPTNG